MSAISNFLNQIKTAIYGEQVRDAIHDSILQCYTDVTNAKTLADQSTTSANSAAASANSAATKANNAAASANSAAQSATTAANNANAAANNASNAKEAANSAAQVATSSANQANDATTAANAAAQAANTAKDNAVTATTAANAAAEAANTAATNANTAKDDAVAATEAVNAAAETINEKAIKSGTEPDLTAGTAEQLVSDETVLDTEPYKLRKTAGSGNRAYLDKIIGGSVVWNQLVTLNPATTIVNGVTYTKNDDMSVSVSGTATENSGYDYIYIPCKANHLYLLWSGVAGGNWSEYIPLYDYNGGAPVTNSYANKGLIYKKTEDGSIRARCQVWAGKTVDFKAHIQIFDLTQMFGSTIADYVYSLEQANAGAGVEWFRKIFPADYYPYNAGELVSVSGLSEHKTVGFNLWDEEWELGAYDNNTGAKIASSNGIRSKNYIKILGNTQYYFLKQYIKYLCFYDANKQFIETQVKNSANGYYLFTTPENAAFMTFYLNNSYGTTYNHDICINLYDPARNGEYEPYAGHSYPLDSTLTLRGIPKLDAENNLYYDGDEYKPDGKVNRKYGIVDLGTLTWSYNTAYSNSPYFLASLSAKRVGAYATTVHPMLNTKYLPANRNAIIGNGGIQDKVIAFDGHATNITQVQIRDSAYTDAAAFKADMSGVYLVYELSTPTEESAEPYAQVQVIGPAGTEEFVSESILPVGHETRYMADLKDRLEHLPDPAANDGLYAIQQTDGKMELVSATFSPGVVENASGAIASFSDGADNVPVKNLVVNIEPVQAGSGDPSPDNVRPISGWTGVKVSRAGINIWDEEWEEGTFNTTTGVNIVYSNQLRSKNIIKIKPNTTYFWNSPMYNWIIFYDKYGNVIEKPVVTDSGTSSKSGNAISVSAMHVFTTPANAYGTRFYTGTYNVPYKNNIGINYPSTDTDYHPGYAKTYDISLPSEAGTVYGGTLDVASGVLTVDRAMVDLGTLNWSNEYVQRYSVFIAKANIAAVNSNKTLCSAYLYSALSVGATRPDKTINVGNPYFDSLRKTITVKDTSYTDVTAFKTAMSGIQLVCELDAPLTYQLTPQEVKTLLGQNNIFADAGDVNVDYIADTKLYIDKKFTELQALVLENVGG